MTPPDPTRKKLRFRVGGLVGQVLVRSLFSTIRCTREGTEHYLRFREEGTSVVFAFWHAQLLPLVHYRRGEGAVVLVSEHADGEYITQIIERNGFGTARGSSTRGGAKGLKAVVRALRNGHDVGITADGPRGPRHEFKWGALVAAQLSGAPVIPVAVGAPRAWLAKSWDKFIIPKPFSLVRLGYAPPHWIPREASEDELVEHAAELQDTLNRMSLRLGGEMDKGGEG